MCKTGKYKYNSAQSAWKALDRVRKRHKRRSVKIKGKIERGAYKCKECKHWHLTNYE